MVVVAVRAELTTLKVHKNTPRMMALETGSMKELEGLKAAGDATVTQQTSVSKKPKKKKRKAAAQAQQNTLQGVEVEPDMRKYAWLECSRSLFVCSFCLLLLLFLVNL